MSDIHQTHPHVPLVVIFDLDDTLFNTELSVNELLLPILAKHGITAGELSSARQAAHQDHNRSLDIISYVIQRAGPEAWEEARRDYEYRGKNLGQLLLPGARAAMDELSSAGVPFGIKTYGNEALQQMKRRAVSFPDTIPFCVIDHRRKGEMLAQMYNRDTDQFEISWLGYSAYRVVMFENDPTAFSGLETHISAGRVVPIWTPTAKDREKKVPPGLVETRDLAAGMRSVEALLHHTIDKT